MDTPNVIDLRRVTDQDDGVVVINANAEISAIWKALDDTLNTEGGGLRAAAALVEVLSKILEKAPAPMAMLFWNVTDQHRKDLLTLLKSPAGVTN